MALPRIRCFVLRFSTKRTAPPASAISGAGRELSEGIGALLAAVVLVSVGIWMHGKSQAGAWQRYIQQKMSHALSRRSAWLLFLLAFVVVYREVFETILFFAALWRPDQASAIVAGVGAAAAVLAASAWALLSHSKRLPIARFFFWSSIMIALLAVVLAGKGIAALQESGWFSINPVAELPRLEILGMYPTWEGIAGQALVLGILLAVFGLARRREGPV
ncbi:iron permease FTR1 [Salinisphaera sp. PC39]|uniref:FTR1 family iron permease n=1 Tax=Salinisphaera sp. PC39 TaxID=1304156 RepID=UPI003342590D